MPTHTDHTVIVPEGKTMLAYLATLTAPFHHGSGTQGNTSLLRTQDVVQPDGTVARVPYLSAASIRHGLRDALAWHTVHTLDIEPGTLTKTTVDLLWSGGAVTSTGSRTDLDMLRRVDTLYPALSLLGYAAKSDIVEGTLRASDLILVCEENRHRVTTATGATLHRASAYRAEEFGTRHDQATSPAGRYIQTAAGGDLTTAQMIWDTQILITGSEMQGTLSLTPAATDMHQTVLMAAWSLWQQDGVAHLGAKTAQGYGTADITQVSWSGAAISRALDDWTTHLTDHSQDIRDLLDELGK